MLEKFPQDFTKEFLNGVSKNMLKEFGKGFYNNCLRNLEVITEWDFNDTGDNEMLLGITKQNYWYRNSHRKEKNVGFFSKKQSEIFSVPLTR